MERPTITSVLERGKRKRALNMSDSDTVTVGLWMSICADTAALTHHQSCEALHIH